MKIVCVSDIHGRLTDVKYQCPDGQIKNAWPAGDILIVAGDNHPNYSRDQIKDAWIQKAHFYERFCPLLSGLLKRGIYKDIVVIAGNHDRLYAYHQEECEDYFKHIGVTYLHDSGAIVQGLKFWGSPWTPWFFGTHWVFNMRGKEAEGLYTPGHTESIWDQIPDDTDVLVTHGPPYGILDKCRNLTTNKPHNVGCPTLLKKVEEVKPRLHVFGHVHEGYGRIDTDDTIFINAAVHNESFKPKNPIQIVGL